MKRNAVVAFVTVTLGAEGCLTPPQAQAAPSAHVDNAEAGAATTPRSGSMQEPPRSTTHMLPDAEAAGPLMSATVERVVAENAGPFRRCYEAGRQRAPALRGRVTVKAIIDPKGFVWLTQDGGSDIADQEIMKCVVEAFGHLSFPRSEGNAVISVHTFVFSPGE